MGPDVKYTVSQRVLDAQPKTCVVKNKKQVCSKAKSDKVFLQDLIKSWHYKKLK